MQYGEIQEYIQDGDTDGMDITKFRHGLPFMRESTRRERVQIMRVDDIVMIYEQMMIDHALDDAFGAWVEKAKDGRLYAVKYWVKKQETSPAK